MGFRRHAIESLLAVGVFGCIGDVSTGEDAMQQLSGALAGWRRSRSSNGIIITLQVAESAEDVNRHTMSRVDLALNDRQLRSLARDLVRAAEQRNLDIFADRHWWTRLFNRQVHSRVDG